MKKPVTAAERNDRTRVARPAFLAVASALTTALVLAGSAGAQGTRWWERAPTGCSIGVSGPTIHRAAAVRSARDHAISELASGHLGVDITSELWLGGRHPRESTWQRTAGLMRGIRIVGLRTDPDGLVIALVCVEEADPSDSLAGGRVCAPGLAGPTLKPRNQLEAARRNGAENLALGLEAQVVSEWRSATGLGMRHMNRVEATEQAEAIVATEDSTEIIWSWLDERGVGPLLEPGILYASVCLVRPERRDPPPGSAAKRSDAERQRR
jgi:hypothetical protein